MIRALYTSATGMRAQETLIDNTANNIANVNTNGFKRSTLDFADLIYLNYRRAGADIVQGRSTPIGMEIGSGVRPTGTTKIFSQGSMEQTDNPTDMTIEGQGFFKVVNGEGVERYTRDGAFRLDNNGTLVNSDGWALDPTITIPTDATNIQIGVDGSLSVISNGDVVNPTQVSQIQVHTFPNPAGLSSEGGNLFAESVASGPATQTIAGTQGTGMIRQGFIERSNVEVVTELISLITAQRAYEINSRAIRAGDQMLQVSAQILG